MFDRSVAGSHAVATVNAVWRRRRLLIVASPVGGWRAARLVLRAAAPLSAGYGAGPDPLSAFSGSTRRVLPDAALWLSKKMRL